MSWVGRELAVQMPGPADQKIQFSDLTTWMKSDAPLSKCFAGDAPISWSEVKNQYPSYGFVEDAEQDRFGIGVTRHSAQTKVG